MRKIYTLFIALLGLICSVDVVAQITVAGKTYVLEAPEGNKDYYIYNSNQGKFLNDNDGLSDVFATYWHINGTNIGSCNLTSEGNKQLYIYIANPNRWTGIGTATVSSSATGKTGDDVTITIEANSGKYNILRSKTFSGLNTLGSRVLSATDKGISLIANWGSEGEWQFISKAQVDEIAERARELSYSKNESDYPQDVTKGNIANPGMTWYGGTWTDNIEAQNNGYMNTGNNYGFNTPYFYEKYKPAGNSLSGKFTNRTLKELPQGKFRLTIQALAADQSAGSEATESGVYVYVSGNKEIKYEPVQLTVQKVQNERAGNFAVEFENSSLQTVEYGLELTSNTVCNWVGVGSVKLEYLGPIDDKYTGLKADFNEAYDALSDYNDFLDENYPDEQKASSFEILNKETIEGVGLTYAQVLDENHTYASLNQSQADLLQTEIYSLKAALLAAQVEHLRIACASVTDKVNNVGFLVGMYAPGNNKEALQKYAAAEEARENDKLPCEPSEIENYITAVKTWSDMNSAEIETLIGNTNFQIGTDGWEGNVSKMTYTANWQTAYAGQAYGTIAYGAVPGYTLPLEANTWYRLTFRYAGENTWSGNTSNGADVSIVCGENEIVSDHTIETPQTTSNFKTYTKDIKTTTAGNYEIKLTSDGSSTIFTDVQLTKLGIDVPGTTVTAANHWGTFISEVERPLVDGLEAYTVTGFEGENLVLTQETESIKPNTAYLLKNTTNQDLTIPTEEKVKSQAKTTEYTTGMLTGVYATKNVPAGDYILYKDATSPTGFYQVGDSYTYWPVVNANRCYLHIDTPAPSQAKAFRLDGVVTSIEATESLINGEMTEVYDVNGAKQNDLKKGMNIVRFANGKTAKILVK